MLIGFADKGTAKFSKVFVNACVFGSGLPMIPRVMTRNGSVMAKPSNDDVFVGIEGGQGIAVRSRHLVAIDIPIEHDNLIGLAVGVVNDLAFGSRERKTVVIGHGRIFAHLETGINNSHH